MIRLKIPLHLGVDTSGTPPTIIGVVSFNLYTKAEIIERFAARFQDYLQKKGRELKHDELKEIIQFLDANGVRMAIREYSVNRWHFITSYFHRLNKGLVEEKILADLIFHGLRSLSYRGVTHIVTICIESRFDTPVIINTCHKLAKMQNYNFELSYGHEKSNLVVKIADYVTAAGRKLKMESLKQFQHMRILDEKIPKWVLRELFDVKGRIPLPP